MEKKIEAFLAGPHCIVGLVGDVGTGKRHAVCATALAKGWKVQCHDRAQRSLDYLRWGAHVLDDAGLCRAVHVVCNADCENDWSFVPRLSPGVKVVCLANDVQALKKGAATAPESNFEILRMPKLSTDQMSKHLFHEEHWCAVVATRLSKLAAGDWRVLRTWERLVRESAVDVSTMDDAAFEEWSARAHKDQFVTCHPSLTANRLLNGEARENANLAERMMDHQTACFVQANVGLHCGTIEEMETMATAAVDSDMMRAAGEEQLGLSYYARAVGSLSGPRVQHSFGKYGDPWKVASSEGIAHVRTSFAERRPWLQGLKQRISREQQAKSAGKPAPKRKAAAKRRSAPKQHRKATTIVSESRGASENLVTESREAAAFCPRWRVLDCDGEPRVKSQHKLSDFPREDTAKCHVHHN